MNSLMIDTLTIVAVVVMSLVLPLLGIRDFRRLTSRVAAGHPDARTRAYAWTIVMEWGLVVGFVTWWLLDGRSLAELRLLPVAAGWQWLVIGFGLAGAALALWQMFRVLGDERELGNLRGQMQHLQGLTPVTPGERRIFDVTAVTAGVCEEILYRGVLLVVLTSVVGIWAAVALSSLVFGLGHAYQGLGGIAKTSLVGLVLALLTVFTGSLFIPMLLHAVIDLTSGRMMAAAMQSEPVAT